MYGREQGEVLGDRRVLIADWASSYFHISSENIITSPLILLSSGNRFVGARV